MDLAFGTIVGVVLRFSKRRQQVPPDRQQQQPRDHREHHIKPNRQRPSHDPAPGAPPLCAPPNSGPSAWASSRLNSTVRPSTARMLPTAPATIRTMGYPVNKPIPSLARS